MTDPPRVNRREGVSQDSASGRNAYQRDCSRWSLLSPPVTFVISVQRDACACSGGLTVAQCVATVDPDMTDADGRPNGVCKGGNIAHGGGIECHQVGGAAHYDAPPAFQPEGIG